MNIRAQAIGLMPEIEQNCMQDLATCKNPDIKGEVRKDLKNICNNCNLFIIIQEMKCLQKRYDELEDQCKTAVRKFTEQTMSDPTLDFLLMKACEPMIQSYCSVNKILLI